MIRTTGNLILDQSLPAVYPNALIEARPVLAPDFSSLSINLLVFMEVQENGATVLKQVATRTWSLAQADILSDEPQIAGILDKLAIAVGKTLIRGLKTFNQGVTFTRE